MDVRVIPEGAGGLILGDLDRVMLGLAGPDLQEHIVADALWRDMQPVGVQVGHVLAHRAHARHMAAHGLRAVLRRGDRVDQVELDHVAGLHPQRVATSLPL
ncbi:MAG: hypothetical protein WDN44_12795 [Sphingomonas sp.]